MFIVSCFILTAKKYLTYFSYFIGEIIGTLLFLIVIHSFFWIHVIHSNKLQYSEKDFIIYLIVSNSTYLLSNIDLAKTMAIDIKTYRLGQSLLYPIQYLRKIITEAIASVSIRFLLIYLPVCIVLFLMYPQNFAFKRIAWYVLSLVMVVILNILCSMLIGVTAFYATEVWGLNAFKNFTFYALSGAFFPFDILSKEIQAIIYLTPFPYTGYFPAKIITDLSFSFSWQYLIVSLFWIFVISGILLLTWKRGLRKYESCGV